MYCLSRDDTEVVAGQINGMTDIAAAHYHAGALAFVLLRGACAPLARCCCGCCVCCLPADCWPGALLQADAHASPPPTAQLTTRRRHTSPLPLPPQA